MRIVALEEHFSLPSLRRSFRRRAESAAVERAPATTSLPTVVAQRRRQDDAISAPAASPNMDRSGRLRAGPFQGGQPHRSERRHVRGRRSSRHLRALSTTRPQDRSRTSPDRFAAFAHLPTRIPAAAADELERTVKELGCKGALVSGTIRGAFLDDPRFAPLFARAESARRSALHPSRNAARGVRKAYYDGFPPKISFGLATFAWGWHYETALHVMRLAVSGTWTDTRGSFFIIGHMGEGLPAMLARCEHQFACDLPHLRRPLLTDHHRSGLRYDLRAFHHAALHGGIRDVRDRSAHVLRRLSLCQQRATAEHSSTRCRSLPRTWPSSRMQTPTGCCGYSPR